MDEIIVFHALSEEHSEADRGDPTRAPAGAAGGAAHHAGADGRGRADLVRTGYDPPTARGR